MSEFWKPCSYCDKLNSIGVLPDGFNEISDKISKPDCLTSCNKICQYAENLHNQIILCIHIDFTVSKFIFSDFTLQLIFKKPPRGKF